MSMLNLSSSIVICGGGIMGTSTAYHLTQRGATNVTLIERSELAAAASGKAGGFLAEGWGDGSVTEPLHRISFRMHAELAKTLDIKSYRAIPTLSCDGSRNGPKLSSWLDGKVSSSLMDNSTAQVTPKELTLKFMEAAQARGATLKLGVAVEGVETTLLSSPQGPQKTITGVKLSDGTTLSCDKLIITMGPWSTQAGTWFDLPLPLQGIKSTSLIFENIPSIQKEPYALFCKEDINGCHLEVYPRPNGDVYLCGVGGSDHVEGLRLLRGGDCSTPEQIVPDPSRVNAASRSFRAMTSATADRVPAVTQACMRPCSPDALPILGGIPGVAGAYICTGHNCWGILWGPVSGLVMAELVLDGRGSTVDLTPFSLERFMPVGKNRGRHKKQDEVGEKW